MEKDGIVLGGVLAAPACLAAGHLAKSLHGTTHEDEQVGEPHQYSALVSNCKLGNSGGPAGLHRVGSQGPVCRLRPRVARPPGGWVFTPPPPLRPAVASDMGRCGRFLFCFQGAYTNGAAIDSPGAGGVYP